jgi:hypothetical protein
MAANFKKLPMETWPFGLGNRLMQCGKIAPRQKFLDKVIVEIVDAKALSINNLNTLYYDKLAQKISLRTSLMPNLSKLKRGLHKCGCETCGLHPYGKLAKEHKAINRVLLGLDEKNKRRFVGVLASQRGNIMQLSQITGLRRNTIYRGQSEVEHPSQNPASGIRLVGCLTLSG